MKKISRKDFGIFAIQLAVWALILLLPPLAVVLTTHNWSNTVTMAVFVWGMMHSPFILYFLNFYLLGPWLFFKRRTLLFVLVNILVIVALNFGFLFIGRPHGPHHHEMPDQAWIGFYSGIFSYLVLNCVVIAVAIGIRHFLEVRKIKQQLEEERHKSTEAELAWLKSQINPHFLFNTLNNISSLTQIDADAAQDAIAQLSDLLRYAIYETNKPKVPVGGEVEFMKNYIGLMKLRCNEKTEVRTYFDISQNVDVAPLLFISLVENAFKHGVSSNRESMIDISMVQENDSLIFVCENSNYAKDDHDRSGSGIGLENTRRRLELMYPGRYVWEQSDENDKFFVKIQLHL